MELSNKFMGGDIWCPFRLRTDSYSRVDVSYVAYLVGTY